MIEANYDEVICPNCVTQFRAIPVTVQDTLRKQSDVLKQALEALEWEHGGEPLPTLTAAAIKELQA